MLKYFTDKLSGYLHIIILPVEIFDREQCNVFTVTDIKTAYEILHITATQSQYFCFI